MKLILTGAVIPSSPVIRSDRVARLLDYRTSLHLWLESGLFNDIEYIDGSGTSILDATLESLAHHQGIRLSETLLDVSATARRFGKGRAEALLLRDAIERTEGTFFKATGRLFVINADRLVSEVERGKCAFFMDYGIADTRFFGVDPDWFRCNLDPVAEEIDDASPATYIEAVYGRVQGWERFSEKPRYHGVNATTGQLL